MLPITKVASFTFRPAGHVGLNSKSYEMKKNRHPGLQYLGTGVGRFDIP